jgi:hypothetical protein
VSADITHSLDGFPQHNLIQIEVYSSGHSKRKIGRRAFSRRERLRDCYLRKALQLRKQAQETTGDVLARRALEAVADGYEQLAETALDAELKALMNRRERILWL